tara:strand:+ start:598 stop:867 length:270 start_codon:yes stop_codon:yes gene_type:complete
MNHVVWSVLRRKDETIQRLWKIQVYSAYHRARRRAERVILESNPLVESVKAESVQIVTEGNKQSTAVLVYSDTESIAAVIEEVERETND